MKKIKYLEINANVRYPEDGKVNGIYDDNDNPKMPFMQSGGMFRIFVDLDTLKVKDWPKGVTADIHYKVCDCGEYYLLDEQFGQLAKYYDDYAPLCLGDYGDYLVFEVTEDGDFKCEKFSRFEPENDDVWIPIKQDEVDVSLFDVSV